jgi:hypothetical protein
MSKKPAANLQSIVASKEDAEPAPFTAAIRTLAPSPAKKQRGAPSVIRDEPLHFKVSGDFKQRFEIRAKRERLFNYALLEKIFEFYETATREGKQAERGQP